MKAKDVSAARINMVLRHKKSGHVYKTILNQQGFSWMQVPSRSLEWPQSALWGFRPSDWLGCSLQILVKSAQLDQTARVARDAGRHITIALGRLVAKEGNPR